MTSSLDREYAQNQTIYFCYAESGDGGGRTTLARARLVEGERPRLDDVRPIFRQQGPLSSGQPFRLPHRADGRTATCSSPPATTSATATRRKTSATIIGKMIRVRPDGSVPPDNPFVNRRGALPEIWSYGHRNMQGAALNPTSGKLWTHEHGPRGGDEVNITEAGKNYGWPVIGYGVDYSGAKIHEATHKPGMEQPVKYWVPSIAPSGMAFYAGDLFPAWRGNLFVGALAGANRWCGSSSTARR